MASSRERENFVYIAKLAEQAERYDGLQHLLIFFDFYLICMKLCCFCLTFDFLLRSHLSVVVICLILFDSVFMPFELGFEARSLVCVVVFPKFFVLLSVVFFSLHDLFET